jgi:hypothetical protein
MSIEALATLVSLAWRVMTGAGVGAAAAAGGCVVGGGAPAGAEFIDDAVEMF